MAGKHDDVFEGRIDALERRIENIKVDYDRRINDLGVKHAAINEITDRNVSRLASIRRDIKIMTDNLSEHMAQEERQREQDQHKYETLETLAKLGANTALDNKLALERQGASLEQVGTQIQAFNDTMSRRVDELPEKIRRAIDAMRGVEAIGWGIGRMLDAATRNKQRVIGGMAALTAIVAAFAAF